MMLKGGRPVDWQSLPVGVGGQQQWLRSSPASPPRTCPRSARPSTTSGRSEPYWQPVFKGYERSKEWIADLKPDVLILVYNDHASAFSLRAHPDVRAGLRGRVPAGRRGLGPAPGADRAGPSGAGLASRPVADPRRVRHDHRQRDGGRPRADRAAVADVRRADRVAGQGHSAGRQRRPVPAAHGQPLLPAWAKRSAGPSSPSIRTSTW